MSVGRYTIMVRDPASGGRSAGIVRALRMELAHAGVEAVPGASTSLVVSGVRSAAWFDALTEVLIGFAERSSKRRIEIADGTASIIIEGPVPRFCLPAVAEFLRRAGQFSAQRPAVVAGERLGPGA